MREERALGVEAPDDRFQVREALNQALFEALQVELEPLDLGVDALDDRIERVAAPGEQAVERLPVRSGPAAPDDLRASIQEMAGRGLKSVILIGGGEPTVYPRFVEFVKFLKELDLRVARAVGTSRRL